MHNGSLILITASPIPVMDENVHLSDLNWFSELWFCKVVYPNNQ
jgi:hypothetical protein